MKTKLENWNELWKNLEDVFCILAYKRLKQQVIMGNQNNNNYPKLKKKSYD